MSIRDSPIGQSAPLRIQVSSDSDYDFLIAEIINEKGAALVISRDQDGGYYVQWPKFDEINTLSAKVSVNDLLIAIEKAKARIG